MAVSHHGKVTVTIPLAALLMLLFAGAAQAWNCAPGLKDCNACVDPQTDVKNCGGCGVKCPPCGNGVPSCVYGKCGFTCNAPYENCDGSWANGCEVDTSIDVNNCGACKAKCIAPPYASASCVSGKCVYTCNPGYKNCDGKWENGCETEVSKEITNCGGCGICCIAPPKATAKCNNGKCEYMCKAGWANCDKEWKNGCECAPDSDVNHCGGCGKKCPQPQYYGGEASCKYGKCERESCKKGMKYDGRKKCCVKGDGGHDGGKHDGDDEGHHGDDEGHHGDDEGHHGDDGKGRKRGD